MSDAKQPVPAKNEDSAKGFFFAVAAYVMWGFLPFYMKALAHISPVEIIAHRIVWSVPVAGLVLVLTKGLDDVKRALRTPKMLAQAALTAALITVNWGIYVWAIGAGHALDTALGYYMNPLFSVFLGAIVLKEKLSLPKKIAIGLAALAVAVLAWDNGGLPWVAVGLCVSWGFYAFFRKTLPVGPNQGFFLEVLILALPALAYILYLQSTGQAHFASTSHLDTVLLMCAGLVTAVPLIVYANGAKLLTLSTIAVLQYIAPTMIFLVAVLVFGEPFGHARMIAFPMIWAALIIYTGSMFAGSKR